MEEWGGVGRRCRAGKGQVQTAVEMAAFKLFPSFPSLVFSLVKPFWKPQGTRAPACAPLFPTWGRGGKREAGGACPCDLFGVRAPAKRRPKLSAPALSSQKRQDIGRRLLAWSSCPRHSAPRGWGRRLPDAESPGGALGQDPNRESRRSRV